jgi:hypothetical protein
LQSAQDGYTGSCVLSGPEAISREDALDLHPDDARRYFEGVDYPASKADLLTAAQVNNAPESFITRLLDLPEGSEFSGPEEAADATRGPAGVG